MRNKAIKIIALVCAAFMLMSTGIYSQNTSRSKMDKVDVRVVSINLYAPHQGMDDRAPGMMKLLKSLDADSIGTQENYPYGDWPKVFEESFDGYKMVGQVGDKQVYPMISDPNRIYYNEERYECVEWDTLMLSAVTEAFGYGSGRSVTWAILRNRETGHEYVHVNTHLAYQSSYIAMTQMRVVAGLMQRFILDGYPVFATGDFNTSEGSASYNMIVAKDGISDSKYVAEKSMNAGTMRGDGDKDLTGRMPIDFCFVSDEQMDVSEYRVFSTYVDGVDLSDHNGLVIDASINPLSAGTALPASGDIEVTEKSSRPYVYEFEICQPYESAANVYCYIAELVDENGKTVDTRKLRCYLIDGEREERHPCTFAGLEEGKPYKVNIYSVTASGLMSAPKTIEISAVRTAVRSDVQK